MPKLSHPANLRTSDYEAQVEYVLYDGNEVQQVFPAWKLNNNDVLVQNGNYIDETYSLNNPVYIVSLNENVDDNGLNKVLPPSKPNLRLLGPPPPPADPYNINLKIETLGINCLNESWAAGKADVSIRAERLTWNGRVDGQPDGEEVSYSSDNTTYDFTGILIRQYYRDETWNGTSLQMIPVNFNLQYDWHFRFWFWQPEIYLYVIFEKDGWPTGLRTDAVKPFLGNDTYTDRFMTYRSADDSYFSGSFYVTSAGFASTYQPPNTTFYPDNSLQEVVEENSCIKFNVIQY